ncbi:MAG TPA: hypothetical protein VFP93_02630 [Gammaproteobacteria bacterium]|nr:hypothetical protein [Gammaproteobacteria bacterium]
MSFEVHVISSNKSPQTFEINNLSLEAVVAFLYDPDKSVGRLTADDVANIIEANKNQASIKIDAITNQVDKEERVLGLTIDGAWDNELFIVKKLTINRDRLALGKVTHKGNSASFASDVDLRNIFKQLQHFDIELSQSDEDSDSSMEEIAINEPPKNLQSTPSSPKNAPNVNAEKVNEVAPEEKNVPKSSEPESKPNPNPDSIADPKKEEMVAKTLKEKLAQKNDNASSLFKVPSLLAAVSFVGRWLLLGLTTTVALVGAAATFVVTGILNLARHYLKRNGYQKVFPEENIESVEGSIAKLSDEDFEVFKHGVDAKNEILNQFKSCFRPKDWVHADKFYAGYTFKEKFPEVNEEDLNSLRKPQAK